QEDTTSPSTEPRRKKRPHAAPWELDRPDAGGGGTYPDVSDYAARYAAASGRSVTDAPWSPPAPEPSAEEGATDHHTGREDDHDPDDHERAQDTTAAPPTERAADRQYTPDRAPAVPELGHGTGEHEAMPPRTHEEEDYGPEWNEHMSVLDRHLIKADTPAPPRPEFADARPTTEQDHQGEDPAEWSEDGKERHPDQPK